MYIKDGIAYADKPTPVYKVNGVRPMANKQLWIRFNTGEAKVFDFSELVKTPAFAPLLDEEVFKSVYIDYGIPVWMNGEIDISPQYLYENSTVENNLTA